MTDQRRAPTASGASQSRRAGPVVVCPEPPESRKSPFLKAHWGAIAAADFFTVEVLTLQGLVRHLVFFVIDLKTRRVHIAGIAQDHRANGRWLEQMARNLTDFDDGMLRGFAHFIVDRDPLYTRHFKEVLAGANVQLLRLPARSPNLNAYAERFVRSIRQECLRHIVPLGEQHLRLVVREFVEHYHVERNHQGLDNVIPFPPAPPRSSAGVFACAKGSAGSSSSMSEKPRDFEAAELWDTTPATRRTPRRRR